MCNIDDLSFEDEDEKEYNYYKNLTNKEFDDAMTEAIGMFAFALVSFFFLGSVLIMTAQVRLTAMMTMKVKMIVTGHQIVLNHQILENLDILIFHNHIEYEHGLKLLEI